MTIEVVYYEEERAIEIKGIVNKYALRYILDNWNEFKKPGKTIRLKTTVRKPPDHNEPI